jgi:hypothetical protein
MKLKDKGFYWSSRILLFVIIIGNVLLFASGYFIPNTEPSKAATEIGAEQKWNDRKVVINRWDYCAGSATMEIEFTIENTTFDGNNEYSFSAEARPTGKTPKIETVISDESFFVVQISNLPARFVELSFRVVLQSEDGQAQDMIKLYANINSANKVPEIKAKTKEEYSLDRFALLIKQKQDELETLDLKISEANEVIENIKADTATREADRHLQTADEQKKTDQAIKANENKIKLQNDEIKRLESEKVKAAEAIDKANDRIEEIKRLM